MIVQHTNILKDLNKNATLTEKVRYIHRILNKRFGLIDRIAVVIYDPKTDMLKTFIHSGGEDPLLHYQAQLSEVASLQEVVKTRNPRIINDLNVFSEGKHGHTRKIVEQGFQSSYTLPMFLNGDFFGFIFFDSFQKNAFQANILDEFDLFAHLISLTIINELTTIRTMLATVKAARDMTSYRDQELGSHLDRIAHYSRLIARELAGKYKFDDEFIEHLFLFAPLHDIGKIGIPDSILRKEEKLNEEEFEVMKTHAERGRDIIDTMLKDFGLDTFKHIDILRNIAEYHHEAFNGDGYPHGIKGRKIPVEARIIAVADIFDALTSQRSYKEAWSNEEAFTMLQELAGLQLDKNCVEALTKNVDEIEKIQKLFKDSQNGSNTKP